MLHIHIFHFKIIITFVCASFSIYCNFSLDPNPEYWEGKRGACAGAMLAIVTQRSNGAPPDGVAELCGLLRDSTHPQAETMMRAMRRYASGAK